MSLEEILGNLLILNLWAFPLSIAEGWAFAEPKKAEKQTNTESLASPGAMDAPGDEAPAAIGDWTPLFERLPDWVQERQRVAGAVGGGCLTAVVVVIGAVAFALYYLFSGQPEQVSQLLPRFAYWLPFALLGLITDAPFDVFDWQDRRLRVVLRLGLWWLPRIGIMAFVINPPVLQDLDPATTALVVLAIDGVLAAFFLWLHAAQQ